MKPILEIQNISKKFRIGGDRSGYKTLRDSLFSGRGKKEDKGEFWALQDVSFDVFPGDSIGIIGKNGAGKSTLLKILSRITPPTKGKIICRGRVASLLEVGTGFHGELSGRENIYLNGSILGLKRTEINSKFDEIVDFSGVEKFLDTPLKHYSSGMQLRLAFAVAAHLEPEILIIDEVLAVGDAEFQKKCLGKMDEISKEQGRTILFVSHNMNALQSLCSKGFILEKGKIISSGDVMRQIDSYMNLVVGRNNFNAEKIKINNKLAIKTLKFSPNPVEIYNDVKFILQIESNEEDIVIYDLAILVFDKFDNRVCIIDLRDNNGNYIINKLSSLLTLNGIIKSIPLVEGVYKIGIFINSNVYVGNNLNLCSFQITLSEMRGKKVTYPADVRGFVELNFEIIK